MTFPLFDLSYATGDARIKDTKFQNRIGELLIQNDILYTSKNKLFGIRNIFVRGNSWIFSGSIRNLSYGERSDNLRSNLNRSVEKARFTVSAAQLQSILSRVILLKLPRSGADTRTSENSRIIAQMISGRDCVMEQSGYPLVRKVRIVTKRISAPYKCQTRP